MRTLVIASQKGGVGKTTLTGHLAVEAERQGEPMVAMMDTDEQMSLSGWFRVRQAETPILVQPVEGNLRKTMDAMRKAGVTLLIIDTPPAITSSISLTVALADLVVIPVRPSPHDLRAVGRTVDIVEQHNKPLVFVVNQANQRARITAQAAISLSQHGPLAEPIIHSRTDFAVSMADGRTVTEMEPEGKSAAEIAALWTFIKGRFDKKDRR
ncbi:ParA family protein [Teichococcus vastitatis]|jgi:chromosome partitioning protein|uniref:ParA family protein n=1 Tax=Teichococcus vastitatis TaxID=2307076 RepID=A0ABS9W902_9PROT|nr:ParA family protein [Pseudoroseomonas vastitatis]MCI0755711.1 ParA family protein [Pseudoroseomonas vastitatis]